MTVFFVLLLVRLSLAAARDRFRRKSLITLIVGIGLWAGGSAVLNGGGDAAATKFPAPGEWFFLASYVAMAAFLYLDARRRVDRALTNWLDAAVVCGGTACLAGGLLLTPVALRFGAEGLPLLVALLYPLIDVVLGLLVVGQVVLRLRPPSGRAVALVGAFFAFAVADSTFVLHLSSGTYQLGAVLYLLWGIGFALLAGAASRTEVDAATPAPRRQGALVLVGAAVVAVLVLVGRPPGRLGWYLAVPAVITLVAVGWRMVLALREARGAAEAYRLARTDDLTELPNRRAVLLRLDEGLAAGGPLALMLLDLDGFKEINDTLGHAAGDAMLELAATRMCRTLGDDVLVARLGGDEFAVVLAADDHLQLVEMAEHLRAVLKAPARVDGLEVAMDASVGIAVRDSHDSTSTDLLRRADVAMYQAKLGRVGALVYDPGRDEFSRQRLRQSEDLRRGIGDGQLVVWYQPQVDAYTEQVRGVEALVRWSHPREGLLPPAAFLPSARRAGLMLSLSEVVLRMVMEDSRRWSDAGYSFRVAMNFAPPELLGGLLLPRLFAAVEEAGLPPESIVVEVTEDSFLADPEKTRSVLTEIRQHQVQISIDDYGTGFSSLSYLRDLPVQELKMDRSFVNAVSTDRRTRMIVASTNQMAQALGLRMVAEGVEDDRTAMEMVRMGVDVLQGFHIARPMPPAQVDAWVRRWTTRAAAGAGLPGHRVG
jgi:diguanylate cyclase (GGDEF)-like protein